MKSVRFSGLLAGGVTVALMLSACGGSSGSGGDETPASGGAVDGAGLSGKCSILQYETTTTAQYRGWQKGLDEFKSENPDRSRPNGEARTACPRVFPFRFVPHANVGKQSGED